MYTLHQRISMVVGLSALAKAFQIDLPTATPTLQGYAVNGFTPKPTEAPSFELRKRAVSGQVCAYVDGSLDYPIVCDYCGYDTDAHWWGCCDGQSDGTLTGCSSITTCVDYLMISSCAANEACSANQHLIGCDDSAKPFCVTNALSIGTDTFSNYYCDTASAVESYFLDATLLGGSTTDDSAATSSAFDMESSSTDESSPPSTKTTSISSARETVAPNGTSASKTATSGLVVPLGGQTAASSITSTAGAAMKTSAAAIGAAGGVVAFVILFTWERT